MKGWIYAALALAAIGTVFPLLRGDGGAAAEGLIGGVGVLLIVLLIGGAVTLTRRLFGKKSDAS